MTLLSQPLFIYIFICLLFHPKGNLPRRKKSKAQQRSYESLASGHSPSTQTVTWQEASQITSVLTKPETGPARVDLRHGQSGPAPGLETQTTEGGER